IFLDEIADMSRPLQAKLLRFLEDGTFARVGGTQELRVNVRLLAATNRDIIQAISADQFREDLFHRLNVVQLRLPPLRERGDDVLLLARHFLKHFSASMNKVTRTISAAARQKLAEQLKITRHALRYRMQRLNISAGTETEEQPAAPVAKEK